MSTNNNQMLDLMKANMLMSNGNNPIYAFVIMSVLEFALKYIKLLTESFQKWIERWANNKFQNTVTKLNIDSVKCEIIFQRRFSQKGRAGTDDQTTVDAVLSRVIDVPEIKAVIYSRTTYIVNYQEEFLIYPKIYFQLIGSEYEEGGELDSIRFRVFCKEQNMEALKKYINEVVDAYELRKKYRLGNHLYFFDHLIRKKDGYGNKIATDFVNFTRTIFQTNRDLDNVFFQQKEEVKTRLELFLKRPDWYQKRGIPHTLGFLMHGPPGSGKCVGLGTPIRMYDGTIKLVEDIKPFELLMGDDSQPRTVLNICSGNEKLYRIKQSHGMTYTVNESHIISLKYSKAPRISWDNSRKCYNIAGVDSQGIVKSIRHYVEQEALIHQYKARVVKKLYLDQAEALKGAEAHMEQLIQSGELLDKGSVIDIPLKEYLTKSASWKKLFKGFRVAVEYPHKEVVIDPYLLGVWLGDGSSKSPAITTTDPEIISYLTKWCLEHDMTVTKRGQITYYMCSKLKIKKSNYFTNGLRKYGVFNNKHIPRDYLINDRNSRLQLLAGLIDTDGYKYDKSNSYEIVQKNEKLADGIVDLCQSLGFYCVKNITIKSCTNSPNPNHSAKYFRLYISVPDINEIPTILARKSRNAKDSLVDMSMSNLTIEPLENGAYFGFELDGNGRFLLGDYTVTHNTSSIKAIANLTQRHIINVNLGQIKCKTQLKQLFHDEKIWVMEKSEVGEKLESYVIPIDKRLYVMEDVDSVDGGSILFRRSDKFKKPVALGPDSGANCTLNPSASSPNTRSPSTLSPSTQREFLKSQSYDTPSLSEPSAELFGDNSGTGNCSPANFSPGGIMSSPGSRNPYDPSKPEEIDPDEKVDLSYILNILDGTLETPGRIIIITSNYPEKLDQALIRPGRIDLILHYEKADKAYIYSMYECFFECKPDSTLIEQIEDHKWTPAEVNQILFKNYNDGPEALKTLGHADPKKYFKLSYFDDTYSDKEKKDLPPAPRGCGSEACVAEATTLLSGRSPVLPPTPRGCGSEACVAEVLPSGSEACVAEATTLLSGRSPVLPSGSEACVAEVLPSGSEACVAEVPVVIPENAIEYGSKEKKRGDVDPENVARCSLRCSVCGGYFKNMAGNCVMCNKNPQELSKRIKLINEYKDKSLRGETQLSLEEYLNNKLAEYRNSKEALQPVELIDKIFTLKSEGLLDGALKPKELLDGAIQEPEHKKTSKDALKVHISCSICPSLPPDERATHCDSCITCLDQSKRNKFDLSVAGLLGAQLCNEYAEKKILGQTQLSLEYYVCENSQEFPEKARLTQEYNEKRYNGETQLSLEDYLNIKLTEYRNSQETLQPAGLIDGTLKSEGTTDETMQTEHKNSSDDDLEVLQLEELKRQNNWQINTNLALEESNKILNNYYVESIRRNVGGTP